MTNTNLLEGIRCPKCGNDQAFYIETRVRVFVTDDAIFDDACHHAWDKDSHCSCTECDKAGTIAEFTIANQ